MALQPRVKNNQPLGHNEQQYMDLALQRRHIKNNLPPQYLQQIYGDIQKRLIPPINIIGIYHLQSQ